MLILVLYNCVQCVNGMKNDSYKIIDGNQFDMSINLVLGLEKIDSLNLDY